MASKNHINPDKTGITSAILCSIHCTIIPVLLLFKSFWSDRQSGFLLPSWWEWLDYLFLMISFYAVYHSARHTGSSKIKLSLWVFWIILAGSILLRENLHWLAYIASAGLIVTHFINIRREKIQSKLIHADEIQTAPDILPVK